MPKRQRVNLSMPDQLKNKARAQAILEGKDLSQVVRELLRMWLEGKVHLPQETSETEDTEQH